MINKVYQTLHSQSDIQYICRATSSGHRPARTFALGARRSFPAVLPVSSQFPYLLSIHAIFTFLTIFLHYSKMLASTLITCFVALSAGLVARAAPADIQKANTLEAAQLNAQYALNEMRDACSSTSLFSGRSCVVYRVDTSFVSPRSGMR